MSYILEALRRAERERRFGQPPTLEAEHFHAAPVVRRLPRWLWAGGVLLAGILLVAGLLWLQSRSTEPLEAVVDGASTRRDERAVAQTSPEERLASPTPPVTRPRAGQTLAPRSAVLEPSPLDAELASAQPPAVRASGKPDRAERRRPPQAARRAAPVEEMRDVSAAPERRPSATPTEAPRSRAERVPQAELSREVAAPAAPPIESEPDPDGGVPQFRELPQSARGEREEPNINVHVYSEDPGQRFVIIRMRRYREGERLEADGPVVERITRDGAVLKDPRSGLRYRVSR